MVLQRNELLIIYQASNNNNLVALSCTQSQILLPSSGLSYEYSADSVLGMVMDACKPSCHHTLSCCRVPPVALVSPGMARAWHGETPMGLKLLSSRCCVPLR